jgi:hypothetical protein
VLHRPWTNALATACVLALLAACQARRVLIVTSDPPGAEVRLDGRIVGTTPHEEEFLHYGVRRVTLYKEGYISHSEVVELKGPWYARFPVDFFSELLVPTGWEDRHEFHAELEAGRSSIPLPQLEGVLERAEELRRAGPEGPPKEKPAAPPQAEPAGGEPAGGSKP